MASRLTTADFFVPESVADQPAPAEGRFHWYTRTKPILEGAAALALLVLMSPFLLIVALLVRLDSPGPALYTQTRVGLDRRRRGRQRFRGANRRRQDVGGQPFKIVKFRSMQSDAEAQTGAVWAQGHDDPRVTRFGRVLRASHVDELPQLVNVLRGDMSLVGPRPERPELFRGLAAQAAHYRARTRVRPGMTGLAQVLLKYDATIDDVRHKIEFDLQYIGRVSLWTDIKILLGTLLRCWNELCEVVRSGGRTERRWVSREI